MFNPSVNSTQQKISCLLQSGTQQLVAISLMSACCTPTNLCAVDAIETMDGERLLTAVGCKAQKDERADAGNLLANWCQQASYVPYLSHCGCIANHQQVWVKQAPLALF